MTHRLVGGLVAASLAFEGLLVVTGATPTMAAVASDFSPGNIISDALFFDGGAMSAPDVQAFLDLKGAACTAGNLCLRAYTATTTAETGDALCAEIAGGVVQTAAQMIASVGAACGISQKVLLVTLQKEQGLVTATAPTASRYRIAMGYGCPDTAACDSQYYGFFNQVYQAARAFKRYAANPQNYNYRAGRLNTVYYNPNLQGCGSSQVFIENQATAGLYIYTPYQPNPSALANLYGTGDSCASYGNRNFWRDYTDWFGSTQVGANLVVSRTNPTVYLVTLDHKYPISDPATLDALWSLAPLGYVSQSFLDSRATGVAMGRFVRDRSGAIWLIDRGMAYLVESCDQLAHWGASCADYATMTLSDAQMSHFVKAGPLTYSVYTPEGKWFAVYSGAKHEVTDAAAAATNWPASTPAVILTEAALMRLPYAAPIVADGTLVRSRSTSLDALVEPTRSFGVAPGLVNATHLRTLVRGLDQASFDLLPPSAGTIAGVVKGPDGSPYGLTESGLLRLAPDQLPQLAATAPTVDAATLAALGPVAGQGIALVKAVGSSALYLATSGVLRPLPAGTTAADFVAAGTVLVTASALSATPLGPQAVPPGHLVKSATGATIYLSDGVATLHRLDSFAISDALGITGWTTVDPAVIAASTIAPYPLGTVIGCGSARYIGSGGQLVPVDQWVVAASGVPVSALDASTCARLRATSATPISAVFVKSPDAPTLYVASKGVKRPLLSMESALAIAAGNPMVIALVSTAALATMPTGPAPLTPGTLVKSADGPTVFLVDGTDRLVSLPTFAVSDAMGIRSWSTVPQSSLDERTVAARPLTTAISCGGARAVAQGGRLIPVATAVFDASGIPSTPLDPTTCAALGLRGAGVNAPLFARGVQWPTLYLITGGTKRLVSTMTQVNTLTGGAAPLVVLTMDDILAAVPTSWPL